MIPLALGVIGQEYKIVKIGGSAEVKQHLADLGFVVGGSATVVSEVGGNLIVNVKETRIAIGKEMALKVMIDGGKNDYIKGSYDWQFCKGFEASW